MKVMRITKNMLVLLLCGLFLIPQWTQAAPVVSAKQLHQEIVNQSQNRQENLSTLEGFLSSKPAKEAIKQLGEDRGRIVEALPQLTDEELARLAGQARTAQANFAGGYHTHDLITVLIVILIVVAILVIVDKA